MRLVKIVAQVAQRRVVTAHELIPSHSRVDGWLINSQEASRIEQPPHLGRVDLLRHEYVQGTRSEEVRNEVFRRRFFGLLVFVSLVNRALEQLQIAQANRVLHLSEMQSLTFLLSK
jgi:hypothetical protein